MTKQRTAEHKVIGEPGMRPAHPGALLRLDVLPAMQLSVSAAAQALGISRQTLHAILREATSISPEMALRLGALCGNGAQLWLAMQQAHDLWHAKRRMATELRRIERHRKVAA
jgi:addiction module HigA family antidote